MIRLRLTVPLLVLASCAVPSARAGGPPKPEAMRVYIGTYTGPKSKGIYVAELDPETGTLSPPKIAAESINPSFLATDSHERFLYAVNEVPNFEGEKAGAVSAYAIDPHTGALKFLNQQSTRGDGPCHLAVDREAKNVLAANYGGGSLAVLPVAADGKLKPASTFIQHTGHGMLRNRQNAPHAHAIGEWPGTPFVVAADLGLDKLLVYRFDSAKGALTPNDPPAASSAPGAGPRHFAIDRQGDHVYANNEINSTVTVFDGDKKRGELSAVQTVSTLPEGYKGSNSTAEIQLHPSGRFLYVSNRGHHSLAIFTVEAKTGRIHAVGHQPTGGKTPRNFAIDPSGTYLYAANQDSDSVVVFRVDPTTGKLEPTGLSANVPAPVCVLFIRKTQ
jgi:6-phosphogluconolactonase